MLVSTYQYWIKNTSFCSLKYENHKYEDCTTTNPKVETKANRRGVGVTRHITPYKTRSMAIFSLQFCENKLWKWHLHEFIDILHVNFSGIDEVNSQFFFVQKILILWSPTANPNIKRIGLL